MKLLPKSAAQISLLLYSATLLFYYYQGLPFTVEFKETFHCLTRHCPYLVNGYFNISTNQPVRGLLRRTKVLALDRE